MKKERLKKVFTDAASEVADEFYPKGISERRGEFIRDCGVLYVRLESNLDAYIKAKKKRPVALEAVMLAEDIMEYFEEVIQGMASDLAFYELIEMCESYFNRTLPSSEFLKYLEFTFGFDGNATLATVKQKAATRYKDMSELLHGKVS